jgi:hypothetical protein
MKQKRAMFFLKSILPQHITSNKEERDWLFPEVKSNHFNSFLFHWKKCEPYLKQLQ